MKRTPAAIPLATAILVAGMAAPRDADATADWSNSFALRTVGGVVNPAVLVGFNPQPEPPAYAGETQFAIVDGAVQLTIAGVSNPGEGPPQNFQFLFGVASPLGASYPLGVEYPPDPIYEFRFPFIVGSGDIGFQAVLDIVSSSGGRPAPGATVAFNPQPEPPALGLGDFQTLSLDFTMTSLSDVTLTLRILDGLDVSGDQLDLVRASAPEPTPLALLALGLVGLGLLSGRRGSRRPASAVALCRRPPSQPASREVRSIVPGFLRRRALATAFGPLAAAIAASAPSGAGATVFGGVEFPEGVASFADAVADYSVGSGGVTAANQMSGAALGAPDYTQGDDCNIIPVCPSVSLGSGGFITLQFTDNRLTGSGDDSPDLWIFEVGPEVEATFVAISKDGIDFVSVGSVEGATAGIDIDAFGFGSSDEFAFVRLTDDPDKGTSVHEAAGADIDAVGAISTRLTNQAPEPATLALFGLGLAGLGLGARRTARRISR